jgi:hypothetical protein
VKKIVVARCVHYTAVEDSTGLYCTVVEQVDDVLGDLGTCCTVLYLTFNIVDCG